MLELFRARQTIIHVNVKTFNKIGRIKHNKLLCQHKSKNAYSFDVITKSINQETLSIISPT